MTLPPPTVYSRGQQPGTGVTPPPAVGTVAPVGATPVPAAPTPAPAPAKAQTQERQPPATWDADIAKVYRPPERTIGNIPAPTYDLSFPQVRVVDGQRVLNIQGNVVPVRTDPTGNILRGGGDYILAPDQSVIPLSDIQNPSGWLQVQTYYLPSQAAAGGPTLSTVTGTAGGVPATGGLQTPTGADLSLITPAMMAAYGVAPNMGDAGRVIVAGMIAKGAAPYSLTPGTKAYQQAVAEGATFDANNIPTFKSAITLAQSMKQAAQVKAGSVPLATRMLTPEGKPLSFEDWSAQLKQQGYVNPTQAMYQEYVAANTTVGLREVGTITQAQLSRFPGATIGDKYAVTESGQEVYLGKGEGVTTASRLYAADATKSGQQLQQARAQVASQEQFNQEHVVIGDRAMTIEDWNSLSPSLQHIALTQGFDALQKTALADIPTSQAMTQPIQDAALAKLSGYKVQVSQPGTHATRDSYRIVDFLKDNRNSPDVAIQTLRDAGFRDADVTDAQQSLYDSDLLQQYGSVTGIRIAANTKLAFSSIASHVPRIVEGLQSFMKYGLTSDMQSPDGAAIARDYDAMLDKVADQYPQIKDDPPRLVVQHVDKMQDMAGGYDSKTNTIVIPYSDDYASIAVADASHVSAHELGHATERDIYDAQQAIMQYNTTLGVAYQELYAEYSAAKNAGGKVDKDEMQAIFAGVVGGVGPYERFYVMPASVFDEVRAQAMADAGLPVGSDDLRLSIKTDFTGGEFTFSEPPKTSPKPTPTLPPTSLMQMRAENATMLAAADRIELAQKAAAPAPPAPEKRWLNVRTGETYTESERTALLQMRPAARDEIVLAPEVVRQAVKTGLEAMANLPEEVAPFLTTGAEHFVELGKSPISKAILSPIAGATLAISLVPVGMIGLSGKLGLAAPKGAGAVFSLVGNTAIDMGKFIGGYATKVWTGGYGDAAATGNFLPLVADTVNTYIMLVGPVKGGMKIAYSLTSFLSPKGMPFSTIGREISTGRIKTPNELAENFADATNEVLKQATTKGKGAINVPVKDTPMSLQSFKTPLNELVGDVLFHGTKDEFDTAGNLVKPSLLRAAEATGEVTAGKGGLYTDPWAAIGYTRGGQNSALMMIVTDASKLKSGAKGLAEGLTQSDKFIRGADEGFYGSSKSWRGDLETEVVGAPGTRVVVPPPTADLITRFTVGSYADFFTNDGAKFVPIKLALDAQNVNTAALEALRSPSKLYAVKLFSLYATLRDNAVALTHPGAVLKDISGITKELFSLKNWFEEGEGKGGTIPFPGVRDVYLVADLGRKIAQASQRLYTLAVGSIRGRLGAVAVDEMMRTDRAAFESLVEREMSEMYREAARSLIEGFKDVAFAYSTDVAVRSAFENTYIANLGIATEATAKSADFSSRLNEAVASSLSGLSEPSIRSVQDALSLSQRAMTGGSFSPNTAPLASIMAALRETNSELGTETPVSPSTVTTPKSSPTTTIESPLSVSGLRSVEARPTETPRTTPETAITSEVTRATVTPTPATRPTSSISTSTTETTRTPRSSQTTRTTSTPVLLSKIGHPTQEITNGSIAWKQGMFWKWIPPEDFHTVGIKPRTLPRGVAPAGALRTHLRTPAETVQMIGDPGAVVPDASINLGVVNIYIRDNASTIEFQGHGELIDVGTMGTPTQGMSIPAVEKTLAEATPLGHAYAKQVYPAHSVSKTAIDATPAPASRTATPAQLQRMRPGIETALTAEEEASSPFDTVGFSDEELGIVKVPRRGVNRPSMSKSKPPRRSSSGGTGGMITLRG